MTPLICTHDHTIIPHSSLHQRRTILNRCMSASLPILSMTARPFHSRRPIPILSCHPPPLLPSVTIIIFSQVYKTQMGRMTEGWNGRIDEFERVNLSLQSSLARLREDNEQLRLQVPTE